MLTDVEIKNLIRSGDIELRDPYGRDVINKITGIEWEMGQLQMIGYELRADQVYSFRMRRWVLLKDLGEYELRPTEFAIVGTYERIRLSKKVGAILHSLARETLDGLEHQPTSIHPGWASNEPEPAYLVVAVKNVSPMPVKLGHKERFCRVVFHRLSSAPELPPPSLDDVKRSFHKYGI